MEGGDESRPAVPSTDASFADAQTLSASHPNEGFDEQPILGMQTRSPMHDNGEDDDSGIVVWVGRVAVVILGAISIAWLPVIPLLGQQLFVYVQLPPAYFAGPVVVVFVGGALLSRATNSGAIVTLGVGWALGAIRFVFEVVRAMTGDTSGEAGSTSVSSRSLFGWFFHVHYLHFAGISAAVSLAILVSVSEMHRCWSPDHPETKVCFYSGIRNDVLQE